MNMQQTIQDKLGVLKPQHLKVINDSHLHAHHDSSPGNGQSHFTVEIAATSLAGKTLLARHKLINNILKDEFSNGLHALSIKIIY